MDAEIIDTIPDENSFMTFAEEEWKVFIAQKALETIR